MVYHIPLFELNYDKEEEKAVLKTLRSGWISAGPNCIELEKEFSNLLNTSYALSLSNCTSALHLALKILGINRKDEVLTPSLTFVAAVNSIRYVSARPVFVDIIGYDDLTIDPGEMEAAITSKTRAIIVMHYGGFPCDMDRILAIAKKHNIKIIEDASHAPASEYKGKKLGTLGDIGCFSFFSNKNISTGEGGMLVTNSEKYYRRAKILRSHGMTSLSYERSKGHQTDYNVVDLGYNYRIDDIRASLALVQLKKLEKDIIKRQNIRELYLRELSAIDAIMIPFKKNREFVSNYVFPIILKNSDKLKRNKTREFLKDKGIETSVHYPAAHRFSIYEKYDSQLPKTEYASENLITLPMHSGLTERKIGYISESLREALRCKIF